MYTFKTYKNGLRLVHNYDNTNRAVSVRFCTLVGGKDEDESNRGIAHLAEHMFFKGTEKRSSLDIIKEFDRLGVSNNAFTSQDMTVFYATGLADMTESIFDILSDCFFHSQYPQNELENEKQVVCSELKMYLDDNRDLMYTNGTGLAMQGTPYEYSLGGTIESVSKLTQEDLKKFHDKFYQPNRLVISVSGNIELDKIEELVEKYVLKECTTDNLTPILYKFDGEKFPTPIRKRFLFTQRDTEQSYVFIGYNRLPNSSDDIMKCFTMLNALGGPMSSRLFIKVREEKGLVYSINSYYSKQMLGPVGVTFMCDHDKLKETFETIKKTFDDIKKNGFTEDELEICKNIAKTNLVLSGLTPSSKASQGATSIIYRDEIFDIDKQIERIDAITVQDLKAMFEEYFDNKYLTVSLIAKENAFDPIEILYK